MVQGCLYAADRQLLRWIPGEPSLERNLSAALWSGEVVGERRFLAGTVLSGRRCQACATLVFRPEGQPET